LYQFEELDCVAPFIDDIYRVAEAQGLPVDAVLQEAGPGQFEINLKHKKDAAGAQAELPKTFSVIDRAAKWGIIKKNTAARYKSRLAVRVRAVAG
jgi:glutamine synthetase